MAAPAAALAGEGTLRRDGTEYAGEVTIYGIAYRLTGHVTADAGGRFFALRAWFAPPPMPPHLHIPLIDDDPPP